ncbi:MAG: 4-alpha-glucanotransferase [Clostridia bacterium]|nr:4-alpha-glucanotransferase [Clostridia bacterium]
MKKAGILLPISALKSKYGIGAFSKDAFEFVDFLKETGQSYWQILPLGPTGFGDSPYQSFSSFAGNPYFISIEKLIEEGLLTEDECAKFDFGRDQRFIDYEKIYKNKIKLLKLAFEKKYLYDDEQYFAFISENVRWIEDYALYMALKDYYGGSPWYEWDVDIKMHQAKALEEYTIRLQREVDFWKFTQYVFYKQWSELKEYANEREIKIIGDIPFYVAYDSADAWSNSAIFEFDINKEPINVAGCPPDGFSPNGQLWGNPLYRWDLQKETDYKWWVYRVEHSFKLYDVLRIDHFRGFDEYYSIPYGEKTAKKGKWVKGPGKDLFDKIKEKIGKKQIIAEDLGFITDSVKELLDHCDFPGMKVFQFAFDERDTGVQNDYMPHNYEENSVAYTGTHDNPTIVSWFFEITEKERKSVRTYLCDFHTPDCDINFPIIGTLMRSNSKLVIIPLQDYLGYDSRARINKPSTIGSNWTWRTIQGDFSQELKKMIYDITKFTGRI